MSCSIAASEALGQVWHLPSAETLTTRAFMRLVFEAAGHPPKMQAMLGVLLAAAALVSPTLKAVREQQYQRTAPWIVDHTKFARAFRRRGDTTPGRCRGNRQLVRSRLRRVTNGRTRQAVRPWSRAVAPPTLEP